MIAKFPTAEMLAARGADPNIRITQAVPAVGNRSHKVTFPVFMDPLRWVYTSQFQPDRARLIGEMLEHGAQVNCRDSDGTPALVLAVCNLDTVVPSLLAHGADVNARDRDGETALMWAIGDHDTNVEMVRLLLSHGANVNMRDKEGETALTRAMNSWQTPQRKQIVALLKQAGAKELPVNRRKRYRSVHRVG
jgi:ankyrin repeat protein